MVTMIKVFAELPREIAPDAEFYLDHDNWYWVHCLNIPVERLGELQLSLRPYKWIRYAIGIIVGSEGDLFCDEDKLNIVDYDARVLSEDLLDLYYHCNDTEKKRMFPIDPHIAHTKATSSTETSRRNEFRDEVSRRDQARCVLTGMPEQVCEAVHLLAHNKGDEYISTLSQGRSRDPERGDLVQLIDSVRNGLFLNRLTHQVMGKEVAFLPTPNFAMNTADVDAAATAHPRETRLTVHLFLPGATFLLGGTGPNISGDPIRIANSPDWPPTILFDAVYAGAILHNFGTLTFKETISSSWKDTFYPNVAMTRGQINLQEIVQERLATRERTELQAAARDIRRNRPRALPAAPHTGAASSPDTFDLALALPYILIPQDKLEDYFRRADEKAEEAEKTRVQEIVKTWRMQVPVHA